MKQAKPPLKRRRNRVSGDSLEELELRSAQALYFAGLYDSVEDALARLRELRQEAALREASRAKRGKRPDVP